MWVWRGFGKGTWNRRVWKVMGLEGMWEYGEYDRGRGNGRGHRGRAGLGR